MRKWVKRLVLMVLFGVGVLLASWILMDAMTSGSFEASLVKYQKISKALTAPGAPGPALSVDGPSTSSLLNDQASRVIDLWEELAQRYHNNNFAKNPEDQYLLDLEKELDREPRELTDSQREGLVRFYEEYQGFFEQMRRIVQCPTTDTTVIVRGWDNEAPVMATRRILRVARYLPRALMESNRREEAFELWTLFQESIAPLTRAPGNAQDLDEQMRFLQFEFREALGHCRKLFDTPERLRRAIEVTDTGAWRRGLATALRCEQTVQIDVAISVLEGDLAPLEIDDDDFWARNGVRLGTLALRPVAQADLTRLWDEQTRLISLLEDSGDPQALEDLFKNTLHEQGNWRFVSQLFMPRIFHSVSTMIDAQTLAGQARLQFAVDLWRMENGAPPPDPESAAQKYLGDIPVHPMRGGKYLYSNETGEVTSTQKEGRR